MYYYPSPERSTSQSTNTTKAQGISQNSITIKCDRYPLKQLLIDYPQFQKTLPEQEKLAKTTFTKMDSARMNPGNENLELKELMQNVQIELERFEFSVRDKLKNNGLTSELKKKMKALLYGVKLLCTEKKQKSVVQEKRIKELVEENMSLQQEIICLQAISKDTTTNNYEINILKQQINQLQNELQMVDKLRCENANLQAKMELQTQLANFTELRSQNDNSKVNEMREQMERLNLNFTQVVMENQELKSQFKTNQNKSFSNFTSIKSTELQQTIDNYDNLLQNERELRQEQCSQIEELNQEICEWKNVYQNLIQQNEQNIGLIQQLNEQWEEKLKIQDNQNGNEIDQLKQTLFDKEQKYQNVISELNNLKVYFFNNLTKQKVQFQNFSENSLIFDENSKIVKEIEQQLNIRNEKIQELASEIKELQFQNQELEQFNQELQIEIQQTDKNNTKESKERYEKQIGQMQTKIFLLCSENERMHQILDEMQFNDQQNDKVQQLEAQLYMITQQKQNYAHEIESWKSQAITLDSQISNQQNQKKQLQEAQQNSAKMAFILQEKEQVINFLNQKLAESEKNLPLVQEMEKKLQTLVCENDRLNSQIVNRCKQRLAGGF